MGTITCTANSNGTLTIDSIAGTNTHNTWARFHGPFFVVSGGGSFTLALTVPFSSFRFNPNDPIEWGPNGQPSWITVQPGTTATALTLQISAATAGVSVFTVLNAMQGGHSIDIAVQSLGGSGGGSGTIAAYVGDDKTTLIGQLPSGAVAAGRDLRFGLKDAGENEIFLLPGSVEIFGLIWNQSQPSYIEVNATSTQITLSIDVPASGKLESVFSLYTSAGLIDPTIVTNPDESAP